MSCTDCTRAAAEQWDGFSAGCKGCVCRGLGRIFLAREERGSRFKRACAQHDVTPDQVREAHAADFMSQGRTP